MRRGTVCNFEELRFKRLAKVKMFTKHRTVIIIKNDATETPRKIVKKGRVEMISDPTENL